MSLLSGQWLWFFDDQLVHSLREVDPGNSRLERRAASHPALVNGVRLWLDGMPHEALEALAPAVEQKDPDGIAMRGQIQFELGLISDAAQTFEELAEVAPGHPCATLNLGLCLARLRNWPDAIPCLQRALLLHPDRGEIWFALGVCLINERRIAEARAAFSHSLRLREDYAPALFGQAVCHQYDGKPEEALAIYERLMDGQPAREQILTNALAAAAAARHAAKVRALASRLLQLQPRSIAPHLAMAWIAIDQGEFDEAARHCEHAAQANPVSFEHWYNYGVCLLRLRQFHLAAPAFERAVQLRPKDPDAYEGWAQSLTETGRIEEAKAARMDLVELAPQRSEAWFRLGLLLAGMGEAREAAGAFERCLEIRREWPEAWTNLAAARWMDGDPQGACEAYQTVLDTSPFHPAARRAMAALAIERGDAPSAERYLDGVAGVDWEILYNLGALLHQEGKLERAAQLYRQVLRAKPDCLEARFNLGSVCFGLGRIEESQTHWKAAVAGRPEFATHFLGWIGQDTLAAQPSTAA